MKISNKAFTLIEILVVISIIGILSGIVVVSLNKANDAANDALKKSALDQLRMNLASYKAMEGSYPIVADSDNCFIGSCPVIDDQLSYYLTKPLPSDSNYKYVSDDGNSFVISSVLSTDYAYIYDSATDTYSSATEKAVNGVCGSSNGANLTSAPIANFCSTGNASSVSGSGPWTWTCAGLNKGYTPTCTANKIEDGVCGTANGSNYSSAPSTDLCNPGNASSVSGSGPWTWTCASTNGGATSGTCTANKIEDGVCGTANGSNYSSAPSTDLCNPGNASSVSGSGPWTWTCASTNGGATSGTCTANKSQDGVCGSANSTNSYIAPSTDLCNPGTASSVSGSGPWTWTCAGLNGGTTSSTCTANKIEDGVCGTANGSYYPSAPSNNLCNPGTASSVSGSGPWTWTCAGLNGGATSGTCTANKSEDGVCGTADGSNYYTAPSTDLCNPGTASSVSGSGPWTWTCASTNGGATSGTCTANKSEDGVCGSSNGASLTSIPTTNLCSTGTASSVSGSGPWTWTCAGLNGGTTASCATVWTCTQSVAFTYKSGSVTYGTVLSPTGKCWMDRNLGATQVATSKTDSSAYGDLFEWGRLDDSHQTRTSSTTSTKSSSNTPGNNKFITSSATPYDWRNPQNTNLWQGVSGTNNPCPTGWRIPTLTEWGSEISTIPLTNYTTAYSSVLKLTVGGYRSYSGSLTSTDVGTNGYYWSSTTNSTKSSYAKFTSSAATTSGTQYRGYGMSVRCIKN